MAAYRTTFKLVEVAGGHHVHMEQPDAVWRLFTALLAGQNG